MKKIVVILFLISVFFISFLPVKDTDFGWHYRCGKEFLKSGSFALCTKNNFSYFLPDYKSYNPHFFYDVGLASTYDHFGFIGVSLMDSIIMVLAAGIFLYLINMPLWLKIIAFYLNLSLSYSIFSLGIRDQILTYLFFLLTLFLLKKSEKNIKYILFLPLLFLIWVNTHIGFFIGPIIFFFYFLGNRKKIILLVFFLSLLMTFLSFFGAEVYQEIINHVFSPLNGMIAEWVPPSIWQIILIIVLTIISLIMIIKQKNKSVFNILLILFFSILAVKARRNLTFFYTTFFYVFLNHWKIEINNLIIPILVSINLFFIITQVPQTVNFDRSWKKYCSQGLSVYPCQAIKNNPQLSGNVYAMYEWGGFLIWQKPNTRVFVDGRMPAWKDENGKSPYQVFIEIIQTQPGWNEKLNKWKTNYLLIANGTFLDLLLQKEPIKYDWQEVYRDDIAVIYKNLFSVSRLRYFFSPSNKDVLSGFNIFRFSHPRF